jgi:tRNA threonylcarbamoyladenosine biosynthesis protein TsaB
MRVLALDTTTRGGSVALVEDDRVVEERAGDASRTHAERLPSEILALADAHAVALADVDLYAVASGPGSFTGLRIGIATIQGLAFVHRRRVAAISALEALAYACDAESAAGTLIAAWMDARRRDVFTAAYRVAGAAPFRAGRLEEIDGPTVGDPSATLTRWIDNLDLRPAIFVGDGAVLYESEIRSALVDGRVVAPPLLAGMIGRLAIARVSDALDPARVRPLYVRKPDAEIARDRKKER